MRLLVSKKNPKHTIFLTAPLSDDGFMSLSDEIKMYNKIISMNNIDFVQIGLWRADSVSLPQKLSSKNFKPIESKKYKNILEGMTFVGTSQ